jgi:hypothetical protein
MPGEFELGGDVLGGGGEEIHSIFLEGIASTVVFGTMNVDDGVPDIYMQGIASTTTIGAMAITYNVTLSGIASTVTFGTSLVYEPVYYSTLSRAS